MDAYNDITPRVGVAYDVFGNGKTAIKFNWGKYLAYAANDPPYTSTNPGVTVVRERARTAAGPTANGNKVVDCDLLNPAAQDGARRRRLRRRRRQHRQLRQARVGDHRQPRGAERLGRAAGRHAVGRHGAAGDHAARVGGGQLHARALPRASSSPTTCNRATSTRRTRPTR